MENFKPRETRIDSPISELAKDEPNELAHPVESSCQGTEAAESMPSDWTDEKHNMFLKSMEASFVSQLYSSMHSVGFCSLRENFSHLKSPGQSKCNAHTHAHFCQFKVLRHGSWKNISFEPTEPRLKVLNETHALSRNPWIHHFRAARKHKNAACKSLAVNSRGCKRISFESTNNSRHMRACSSYLSQQHVSSNTEVSDQNFVDEDNKVEKESSECNAKRVKTPETNGSSNDQVVPSSKFHEGADVNKNSITTS